MVESESFHGKRKLGEEAVIWFSIIYCHKVYSLLTALEKHRCKTFLKCSHVLMHECPVPLLEYSPNSVGNAELTACSVCGQLFSQLWVVTPQTAILSQEKPCSTFDHVQSLFLFWRGG